MRGGRISGRDRDRDTQLRAELIQWTERSRRMNQALQNMYERLHRMNEQASLLDKRLRRHTEETESWHRTWDDSPKRLRG
jgi:predicted  nucleic acid-binding Zn-ribbon protein